MQIYTHFGMYNLATGFIILQQIHMTEKYILIAYMLVVSFKTRTQSFWQDYKGV